MARKNPYTAFPSPSLYANAGTLLFFLEPFNSWQRVRAFSEVTIRRRVDHVRHFIRFCEERGVTTPEEVSRQVVERYQRHLCHVPSARKKAPLSLFGQLQYLYTLRAFFRFLSKERHLLYNPTSEMELPRPGKRLPRHVLTLEEAEAVLNSADPAGVLGLRDRALLETLYSTGIRRSECVNLKVYDLDLLNHTVFIRQGKGKKDRMVPIGARAVLWLQKYLTEVRPELVREPDSQYLFLTPAGEFLAPDYLTERVRFYVHKSGIGKEGSCHLFRHTMATLMLEGGADVRYVQAMLGHSQLSTTEIYTHVSIRKLKDVHERTHPARMKPIGWIDPLPEGQETGNASSP
ncbi:MAG TPA: site-specific tyrosine recombinase XerC [Fibrobacteria bacterium]|nr:site-specific tyrosine recombinase XerC [Fibrobacteria bacterium]